MVWEEGPSETQIPILFPSPREISYISICCSDKIYFYPDEGKEALVPQISVLEASRVRKMSYHSYNPAKVSESKWCKEGIFRNDLPA